MILDILGDLLSKSQISLHVSRLISPPAVLVIPFHLIWRFRVRLSQKLILASTLCLTVLTIMCTITRVAGVRTSSSNSSLDTVWQTYWQYITANIALTMTAATAFRAFFVSRHKDRPGQRLGSKESLLNRSWRFLKGMLRPWTWQGKGSALRISEGGSRERVMELPWIEDRATMTGMRTFINRQGETDED